MTIRLTRVITTQGTTNKDSSSICFWATTVMELSYSVPEDGEYFLK